MDLAAETHRLRLDLLAVEASASLTAAGIPHVLIKGPSTSRWLYEPPRPYNDVDLLVPASRLLDAADALRAARVAEGALGGVGVESAHSHTLTSSSGYALDLHVSLPTMPPPEDDAVWDVLRGHLTMLDLGVGSVPALDDAGRCVVVALHALASGEWQIQRTEDLRRAESAASAETWAEAARIAYSLDADDLFRAGRLRTQTEVDLSTMSPRAYLHFVGGSAEAMSVDRLLTTPRAKLAGVLWREVWPSAAFLRQAYPPTTTTGFGLARARLRRWGRLARLAPSLVRETRSARRR